MIYAVSFRIKNEGNHTERWQTLIDAIRIEGGGVGEVWEETTSFFLLNSQHSADQLAAALNLGSSFSETRDQLLVINLSRKDYATRGKFEYPNTFASLMAAR